MKGKGLYQDIINNINKLMGSDVKISDGEMHYINSNYMGQL